MTVLMFDRAMLAELRRDVAATKERGEDEFVFYGNTLLVSYAEYVIEYLAPQLDGISRPDTVH